MFRRRWWILGLFVVILVLVPSVLASTPIEIKGYFFWAPEGSPYNYCLFTVDENDVPDGNIEGCVVQPEKPGRAQKGILYKMSPWDVVEPEEADGWCEYNLATFDIPGRPDEPGVPRFSANQCYGSWENMHMIGVGEAGGFSWTGQYHFDP